MDMFKRAFNQLAEHLRQRDYTPENMERLKTLSLEMDDAWQTMDYPVFKMTIDRMMQIPWEITDRG